MIIRSLFLVIITVGCLPINKDPDLKVHDRVFNLNLGVEILHDYLGKNQKVFNYKISNKKYDTLFFKNKNIKKLCFKLKDYSLCSHTTYSNSKKFIVDFLTRPSWEIEFYNPESSPKPNYHLVYFSDVSDREKCSNYLSKKHKPIEDWYYTNKFWSLKKCLGIKK